MTIELIRFAEPSDNAENFPSIHASLNAESAPDLGKIVFYLLNSKKIAFSGGISDLDILTPNSTRRLVGKDVRSDGRAVWREGLAFYVAHHNLRLPQSFLEHGRAIGWIPPTTRESPAIMEAVSRL
jgi:hypothetical protein